MEGTQIGTYRIERTLGRGGFGVVYIGVDTRLGRRAAIKQLLPELSNNREIVERFFNEAKAAANINHPGIVEIYDVGWHTDGSAYFAMKLLDGDSLAKRLRSGALSIPMAATIARQVSSALIAAHARGIVHRDLKPDNIILIPDDEVAIGERAVVLDFGIAKLGGADGMSHTRSGMMMGTPGYMSPEQCRGAGEVDHRTDLYALGCILFEMLTGRIPFVGAGPGEVMGMHQFVEPPLLRSLRADAPPELEALVSRLLAKKLDQRLQLMTDVQTALQVFATGGRSREQPVAAPSASTPMPVSAPATGEPIANPVAATAVSEREQPAPRIPNAISEAARVANVAPRTVDLPTQPSTFSAARGEIAPEKKSSKKGLMIGIGVVAMGGIGIGIAIAVGGGGGKSDPITTPTPPDVALVAIADAKRDDITVADAAAVVDATVIDDAAKIAVVVDAAVAAPAGPSTALTAECKSLVKARRWPDLQDCARRLIAANVPTGKTFAALAEMEAQAEVEFQKVSEAASAGDRAAARRFLAAIPIASGYRAEAKKIVDGMAETPPTVPADKLTAGYACPPGTPNKATGTCTCPVGYKAKLDAQSFATCERTAPPIAKYACSPGTPVADVGCTCPPTHMQFLAKGVARCVTGSAPGFLPLSEAPAANPCIDAAAATAVEQRGDLAMGNGSFVQALMLFESIGQCRDVAIKAYLAACRARAFPKAKKYFDQVGKASLAQICLKEGFDPRK